MKYQLNEDELYEQSTKELEQFSFVDAITMKSWLFFPPFYLLGIFFRPWYLEYDVRIDGKIYSCRY
jgi:hypothetical protein